MFLQNQILISKINQLYSNKMYNISVFETKKKELKKKQREENLIIKMEEKRKSK